MKSEICMIAPTAHQAARRSRRGLCAWLARSAFAATLSLAGAAHAADFPSRGVRIIVPSTPGGALDVLGRIFGPRLSAKWGQPVFIENRAGAGGIIGTDVVAKAAPDGHTLLLVTTGLTTNPFLYKSLPYKTLGDFTPITILGVAPTVLVAHPSLGVKSVQELIALAKSKPGMLNYASSGVGTAGQLSMQLFTQMAGVEMTHVPYSGAGASTAAVVSGQTQISSSGLSAVAPFVAARSLVPLAIMANHRNDAMPDVPAVTEVGLPSYSAEGWYAVVGPAGMPPQVVEKIYADVMEVMHTPDVAAQLKKLGFEPGGMKPAEFSRYLQNDMATWKKVLADNPPQDAKN